MSEFATPSWVKLAEETLAQTAREYQNKSKAKHSALAAQAARHRDPLGRFLRSPLGKRLNGTNRFVVNISVPLALAETFRVEAADAKLSFGRMIVVLAALGLPLWREYRESFLHGVDENGIALPMVVRSILDNAVNPTPPQSKRAWSAWHKEVEDLLLASKPKPKQPKDPTAALLAGLGGGQGAP